MTTELTFLGWAVVLGFVQLVLAASAKTKAYGLQWAMSSRDDAPADTLSLFAERLGRAQCNFMETFPLFATAVLIAMFLKTSSFLTVTGCQLYFWSRLLYVPLYAFGIPYIRSLIWGVSIVGILMLLAATLPI